MKTITENEVKQLNETLTMLGFLPVSPRELALMETTNGKDIEERWLNALLGVNFAK